MMLTSSQVCWPGQFKMGEPIFTVCRKGQLVLRMASLNFVLLVSSCLQISPQWNNFPSECLHIWEWKTGLAPKCPWPQLPPLITILQLPQPDILGPQCLYLITSSSKPTERMPSEYRGLVQGGHQGCISCGILVSGIWARGASSEHMENMEMFSCSPT